MIDGDLFDLNASIQENGRTDSETESDVEIIELQRKYW